MPEVSILVKAKDEASAILGNVGKSAQGLGDVMGSLGFVAPMTLGAISTGVTKLALDAAALEPIKLSFDRLSESIDTTSDALLNKLRPATMGILGMKDLMIPAMKMISMGLVDTADEAANLAGMAVKLSVAMGIDAAQGLERFTEMYGMGTTRSLKEFGISVDAVRQRIEQLTATNKDMTQIQAFQIAVMEQGQKTLDNMGDISDTTKVKMDQLKVSMGGLKREVGEALLPALDSTVEILLKLTESSKEHKEETWELMKAYDPLTHMIVDAKEAWKDMQPGIEWINRQLDEHGFKAVVLSEDIKKIVDANDLWRDKTELSTDALKGQVNWIDKTTEAFKRQRAAMAEATIAEQEQQRRIGLLFPEPSAIKGIMDEIRKEIMATDPRIASAHAALDVEKRTYEESLAALEANEEAKKLLYEDAQKRLEETRAGMHGIPGAYDVQAIVSESLLPYKEEWENAHKVVEGAEEAHIDRMKALEGTYAGTVEGALTPALATWNKYLRTVDEANKMAAESHARAIIDAWDGAMPTAYDVLAQMVEDGEVKLGDLDLATGELMRNMLDDYGSMPPAVREAMGGIRRSIIDDTLDPAIEKAKDLGSELNNLDGRKVDIYVTYYYEHMGELPPAGVPTPEPTGAALLEKLRL